MLRKVVTAEQFGHRLDTTTPMRSMPDFARSRAETVAELLRSYNLAEHTPMEAMLFISELKRLLNER